MDFWAIVGDIVALLAASLVLGGLFSRFDQSPIVGYLIAGMVLGGPGSVGVVRSQHEIEAIAELGVALLLYTLGLEFSFTRLRSLGARALGAGGIQVIATLAAAAFTGCALGLGVRPSIAVGAMVALSSTAIVLRTLMERAEIDAPHGRNSLAVLLVQDVAVVPLAMLMTLLAGDAAPAVMLTRVCYLGAVGAGLAMLLFLFNKVAVYALGTMTLHRNRELTVILAVVTGLGAAWAAHAAGFSPALGAFVAGMLLGSSAFATQIRADVSSLRVVLLTLFFGAAGMVADPIWIYEHWYLVASATLLITIGKFIIVAIIFMALGQPVQVATASGLCLAQIGEFAFVLGTIGRASGVVSESLYAIVVSSAIASFFLTAFLVPVAPRFGAWLARRARSMSPTNDGATTRTGEIEVVVIGFGPAGQVAVRPLVGADKRVAVIDLNRQGAREAESLGFHGEVGDATQHEVLEHARIRGAEFVLITVPHHGTAMTILEIVRQMAPQAHVAVRSRLHAHSKGFVDAGAHAVVGDEERVGEGLAGVLRQWLDAARPR
ncbi:MAG TPA: cation:proton antiporter [Phycisphaerae bacterium]|nr:cation:proton antiporter [Phycisphaerae bacterium]HRW52529.1 cation:proton antiporter [Phycisphaerae bacterium]